MRRYDEVAIIGIDKNIARSFSSFSMNFRLGIRLLSQHNEVIV